MLYLRYSPVPDVEQRLDRLRNARNYLDGGLSEPTPVLGELRRHAFAASVHYSTRIEGNVLGLAEVESLLRGEQVTAQEDQIQEVVNYAEAIRYVQSVAAQPYSPITEATLKTIHFLVSKSLAGPYEPGRYRTEQNYIVDRISRSVVFRPPPPEEVPTLMREFVEWINGARIQSEPVFPAALSHLNLVAIHPFADGNGRAARVIEALILYLAGYKSYELVSLEEFFGRDTQSYYAAIRNSLGYVYQPEQMDIASWMDYYLGAHVAQAEAAVQLDMTASSRVMGFMVEFDVESDKAVAMYVACEYGSMTNSIYRGLASVTNQTAANHLRDLVELGLLQIVGRGRATRYEPTERALSVFRAFTPEGNA